MSDIRQLEEGFNVFLASDNNGRLTDRDLPHTKFAVIRWLLSVRMHSVNSIYSKKETKTL